MAAYERDLRRAQQVEEMSRLADRLQRMLSVHQQSFPLAQPPVAPAPEPVDVAAFERPLRRDALRGIAFYKLGERREAKRKARQAAEWEGNRERVRQEQEQKEAQAQLDEAWKRLIANDADTVLATLEEAFQDNQAPAVPVDCERGRVTVLMLMEGEGSVPERVPKLTATGRPSSRKLTQTERSELYLAWLSSNLLATVREALAVAPGLDAVTVVVLRREPPTPFGERPLSAIYAGTLTREQCGRIVWDRPEALDAIFYAENLLIETKGRTKRLMPIALSAHPDLAEIVAEVGKTLADVGAGERGA